MGLVSLEHMEKVRLLIVDDENAFRRTVAKRLMKRGIDTKQAVSGEECLEILKKDPVDVVVLDVKMPGMDGIETLHHIKKKYPKTEVIMLTGHATTQDGVDGIKTGAFDYLSKPIELEHLLGKIRQAYEKLVREEEKQKEAANKDVEIVQVIDPAIRTIWTDPYKLRQVLINIITNAVHATGPGGKITATLEPVDDRVALTIQDTGQGIPKEHLKKIFEPFFSTKPPGEGTGLGLFVTRSIIEKLGGEMDVESQLGQGTSFCIRLPRYPDAEGELDKS